MTKTYPFYRAAGRPVELGRQHGEQAAEKIRGFLDYLAGQLRLSCESLRARARRFMPLFETQCPHLLEWQSVRESLCRICDVVAEPI